MGASTKKQQGSTNKSLAQWYRVGSCDFQDVAGWLMKIPSSLPAIVINLNRRIDRFFMCNIYCIFYAIFDLYATSDCRE